MTSRFHATADAPTELIFRSSRAKSVIYAAASLGCMFIGWLLVNASPSRRYPQAEIEFAGWLMIAFTGVAAPAWILSLLKPTCLFVGVTGFRLVYAYKPARSYLWRDIDHFWTLERGPVVFVVWSFNQQSGLNTAWRYDGYLPAELDLSGLELCDLMNEQHKMACIGSAQSG